MASLSQDDIEKYSPPKAAFARYLVRSRTIQDINKVPRDRIPKSIVDIDSFSGNITADHYPAKSKDGALVDPANLKIGIVGAGIAGIYTAYLLQSLGIHYEILEANPDRVGGRLYTHYFGEQKDGTHQYYDIGAMRFPDSPIMSRTFNLMKRTGTTKGKYIMKCDDQPMRYNDITRVLPKVDSWKDDPFQVSVENSGPVPLQTVRNPDEILNDAFFPYRRKIKRALEAYVKHCKDVPPEKQDDAWRVTEEKLLEDLERAWNYLMQHDKFSLRDYLSFVEGQDDESIHWLETLNAGTGWFDEAFSENVIDSLAFDYNDSDPTIPENPIDWYYIENGTYKLTMNTLKQLKPEGDPGANEKLGSEQTHKFGKLYMGKMVTGMALDKPKQGSGKATLERKIKVSVRNEAEARTYDTVFCSTTFGAMQKMDLTGLELPYGTKAAVRSLRYDASTKVAIQFTNAWWIKSDKVTDAGGLTNVKGGLGKTDMPLRTCVYPSYNLEDKGDAVLLCSYTWGSDSERIASMINPVSTKNGGDATSQPESESLLKETMIDNLARLHSEDQATYDKMKEIISTSYKTHHAYDWTKDPYTCGGAFALFSPTQFQTLYPNIVRPTADSRLHIIGEAASAHHAWIVGALDSSIRAVYLMLERFKLKDKQAELLKEWGPIGEVDEKTAHLQVALGMIDRSYFWWSLSNLVMPK